MACCGGSGMTAEEEAQMREERKRNKEVERVMAEANQADQQINKLLLLGTGESGKSTLFKQMQLIHGKGFKEERATFIPTIHSNVLTTMKTLCEQSNRLMGEGFPTQVTPALQPSKDWFLDAKIDTDTVLTPEIAQHVQALWNDPGIQATYDRRSSFQLIDSAKYFFSKVLEIAKPGWQPSDDDILRARVRTTGIVENQFEMEGNKFTMFDVGGQRNERKKWIHCFEAVTALLFVVSISEYDQVLFEDETTNRMEEAKTLFGETIALQWFKKTSIILFLNKRDLFEEKIKRVPLEQFQPAFASWKEEHKGGSLYEAGLDFMQHMFDTVYAMKRPNTNSPLYVHKTCATDTTLMRTVFNTVKDVVIRKSLSEGGLLT